MGNVTNRAWPAWMLCGARSDQPLVMLAGLGAEICRPGGFFAEFLVGVMRRQPFGSVVAETLVARTPGPSRQP
jgi:hypothetical protein